MRVLPLATKTPPYYGRNMAFGCRKPKEETYEDLLKKRYNNEFKKSQRI